MKWGSHWHLNGNLFRDRFHFERENERLQKEVDRSTETFIKHYKEKYTHPVEPPCWMSLEVSSLGLLSLIFRNLKKGSEKHAIARYYGLTRVDILENWIHAFSNLRNICAHHSRLWNRRLTTLIKLPTHPTNLFITNLDILPYKIYAALCCTKYVLDKISPGHTFTKRLVDLMSTCPLAQEKEMGFPEDWKKEPFWN